MASESGEPREQFSTEHFSQLGEIVRDYREGNDLDAFHFSGRCGITGSNTIANIEDGTVPRLETFVKLASGMDMTPQALFDEMTRRALLETEPSS